MWMASTYNLDVDAIHIQRRIALAGLTRDAVAREAAVHPSVLSRVLRGHRPPPPDFEQRVIAAIELLERAEAAAREARARVLAEGRAA